MAVPTITTCSPVSGPAGGRQFVQITGTNFRTPNAPPVSGPADAPEDTMTVTFGGLAATSIAVVSAVSLFCLTPVNPELGAVDVVVQNLDDDGDAIAGETATLASGYTYALTKLAERSDLERVEDALIVAIATQICPEAMFTVDTDYDSDNADGLHIPDNTKLPAIVLIGPEMDDAFEFGGNLHTAEAVTDDDGDITHYNNRVPAIPVDLEYQVVVLAGSRRAFLRLMVDAKEFTRRMPKLSVDRDGSDPSVGQIEFHLQITDSPRSTIVPNLSNIRTFAFGLSIRGVPLEGTRGDDDARVYERTYPVDTVNAGVYPTPS